MDKILNINGELTTNKYVFQVPIISTVDNPNVQVEIEYDSDFTINTSKTQLTSGVLNGNTWEVSLLKDQPQSIQIYFDFNEPNVIQKSYTFKADIVSGLDTEQPNNVDEVEVQYEKIYTEVSGSTNPIVSCRCIDLSKYSSYPNGLIPRWAVNDGIVNGSSANFDSATGSLVVVHDNPTKSITGTWDLYAKDAQGNETLISKDETFTVPPLFTDISFVNHTRVIGKGSDLSQEDFNKYSEIYTSLSVESCIDYLKNSEGTITSLMVIDCETRENLTTIECLDESYQALSNCDSCDNPKDKVNLPDEPENKDLHSVKFNDGIVVHYTYNGTEWVETCKMDYRTKEDYPIELSGKLCTTDDKVIFVYNTNGVTSYKHTDGTDYLGDVLELTECCCKNTENE